jgi:Ca2+-binding EF-hand superfamily protein
MTEKPQQPSTLRAKFGIQKRSSSLKLSSRTLNVYKEAFSAIDKSGTGSINKTQLKTVLSKLGITRFNSQDNGEF